MNDTTAEKNGDEIVSSVSETKDLYAVLDVPKNATDKQISSAYKKLALKYHPDRNQDNEEAALMFKSVSEAYHVLIDPTKRKQYDAVDEKSPVESENVDVTSLGGIGRALGSLMSRLTVPNPNSAEIAAEVTETAHTICRNGGLEGGGPPLDPRVSDLAWGWPIDSKVDRQAATYYRINVDNRHVENGFVVLCRSQAKGKFKLILFDAEGSVLFQEESAQTRDKKAFTQAALYFTNFDTYRVGEPAPAADKEVPATFAKLEAFTGCRHSITPGQYLLCVYGDNFIGKTHFNIIAVQAKNDAPEVTELEEADEALVESKASLDVMRAEYVAAKAAYEAVQGRMEAEGKKVDTLLQTRDKAYIGFFDASIKAFSPSAAVVNPSGEAAAPSASAAASTSSAAKADDESTPAEGAAAPAAQPTFQAAAFSVAATAASSAASTATSVGTTAAQNVTAAGGWLARRVSLGLASIVKPASSSERARTASEEASAATAAAAVATETPASASTEQNAEESQDSAPVAASTTPSEPVAAAAVEQPAVVAPVAAAPVVPDVHAAAAASGVTRPVIKSKKDKARAATVAAAEEEQGEEAAVHTAASEEA